MNPLTINAGQVSRALEFIDRELQSYSSVLQRLDDAMQSGLQDDQISACCAALRALVVTSLTSLEAKKQELEHLRSGVLIARPGI